MVAGESRGLRRAEWRFRQFYAFILALGFIALAYVVGGEYWPDQPNMTWVVVGAAGYGVIYLVPRLLRHRRCETRRLLIARGLNLDTAVSWTAGPEGLVVEYRGLRCAAEWKTVTDVVVTPSALVFLVAASPWHIPRRFFADLPAQKDFLRGALSYMHDESRQRSAAAAKFASAA